MLFVGSALASHRVTFLRDVEGPKEQGRDGIDYLHVFG